MSFNDQISNLDFPPISEKEIKELYLKHASHWPKPCCSCAETIDILREEVKSLQKSQVSIKQDTKEILAIMRTRN